MEVVVANVSTTARVPRTALYVVTSVVTLAVYARLAVLPASPGMWVAIPFLVALASIDWRVRRLPTPVIYAALASVLLTDVLGALVAHKGRFLLLALLGMIVEWTWWRLVKSAYKDQLGWGDVRLSALLGLVVGAWGLVAVLAALFVAMVSASAFGIVKGVRERLPLGTFLIAGALVVILLGPAPFTRPLGV
jgi:leader peptidase (prepilin peptidase)/N-methyltransferase